MSEHTTACDTDRYAHTKFEPFYESDAYASRALHEHNKETKKSNQKNQVRYPREQFVAIFYKKM
jgi:hypothetical protein